MIWAKTRLCLQSVVVKRRAFFNGAPLLFWINTKLYARRAPLRWCGEKGVSMCRLWSPHPSRQSRATFSAGEGFKVSSLRSADAHSAPLHKFAVISSQNNSHIANSTATI